MNRECNPAAVEQIVSADESARMAVEGAQRVAGEILSRAGEEAKAILDCLEQYNLEKERRDILPIVSAGQEQAERTMEQAEQYVARLRQVLALKKRNIVTTCIESVVTTGSP
ncbi:hypothetical protein [Desulfogranum mediterraneum]|uniref:hypothetical protein n=1 Tax=Desulfogranum mediterraneum TaxID=160661 RepID=UPI000424F771|nr:hypothetical protein [Desulfogranum mediterraneum]